MRKAVKQQIIQLIDTILEAHIEIKKSIDSEAFNNARSILADCQDCAVMVGNTIEQFDDSQSEIITKLERYCEQLFIIHGQLESNQQSSAEIKKILDANVKEIRNEILNKIKVELKVVFMPYKASMWTSLESVWKAADADPDCEAKVVVIPYATLDSKQQLDHIEYEADKFPEYVPITHYSEYSLEKEQPDMIFIHNPYDGGNNVTRIPEKYYSFNLKKYTEKLIYSPYGMMGFYNPDKGAFMCDTSAVFFADKVLVQSEKVKQIYIDQGVSREKLCALGSPKVDAIVNNKKQPVIYPDGWEDKLKGRKVFLLNTHLSYFVNGYIYTKNYPGRKDYAKVAHDAIFNRLIDAENCALIWRPHPLLKDMLKSRELYDSLEYVEQLEQRIADSSNAVLDTNGDYSISFRISDALVTTYSSMISEYMISGKPTYVYQQCLNEDLCRKSPVSYLNNYFRTKDGRPPQFLEFVEMVLSGEDYKYEQRMQDVHRAFSNLEGTIGAKIYCRLKEDWMLSL